LEHLNQILMPFIKVIHVISGVFWVGTIAFLTVVLEPHYRKQGRNILRNQMTSILPVMGPFLLIATLLSIISGAVMISILGYSWLTTLNGQIIIIGAVAAIVAFIVGDIWVRIERNKLRDYGGYLATQTLEGNPPGVEDSNKVKRLEDRLWFLGRLNFAILLVALTSMTIAQYL
jgi:uncharacterized membrane protein